MTATEAKELCLEVWEYLAQHPEVKAKSNLPEGLYLRIRDLVDLCPLCEYFSHGNTGGFKRRRCSDCPLKSCQMKDDTAWNRWNWSTSDRSRINAAEAIVYRVKAWDAEALDKDEAKEAKK